MRKYFFVTLAIFAFCFGVLLQNSGLDGLPTNLYLSNNESVGFSFNLPVKLSVTDESNPVVYCGNESLDDKNHEIQSKNTGKSSVQVEVFGIPLKTINVNVSEKKQVIPGGQSIGVALYTKGALVVGFLDIKTESGKSINPAKEVGIEAGDVIISINGVEIKDANHLIDNINNLDIKTANIILIRQGNQLEYNVTPVKNTNDGKFAFGVWVRDSMAGIGTMSFAIPSDMKYASLGHAITDIDTQALLSVKTGEIVESNIVSVKPGKKGEPGELQGGFAEDKNPIGDIYKNNSFGIYGNIYKLPQNSLYDKTIETALNDEIKVGPAKILTTISENGIEEFDCEIIKLSNQQTPTTKSMVIQITDSKLLAKTGGIVQGMSGSPIIQNGKLIGAVTHVLVNDPTKGYGLYAEWMLQEMD